MKKLVLLTSIFTFIPLSQAQERPLQKLFDKLIGVTNAPQEETVPAPQPKPRPLLRGKGLTARNSNRRSSDASSSEKKVVFGGLFNSGSRQDFLRRLYPYIGDDYKWSREEPGAFDCSGLVYYGAKTYVRAKGRPGDAPARHSCEAFATNLSRHKLPSCASAKPADVIIWINYKRSSDHIGYVVQVKSAREITFLNASSSEDKVLISTWTHGSFNGVRPTCYRNPWI